MYVFQHATSLGGVESLIEWRALSDRLCDNLFIRVSCGVEEVEGLETDIIQGLHSMLDNLPAYPLPQV